MQHPLQMQMKHCKFKHNYQFQINFSNILDSELATNAYITGNVKVLLKGILQ